MLVTTRYSQAQITWFPAQQSSTVHVPSSRWCRPLESRNSLDPLASQMWMFLLDSSFALVLPDTNQRSSSATPRQNTRLVVSNGNWPRRLNLGEKHDIMITVCYTQSISHKPTWQSKLHYTTKLTRPSGLELVTTLMLPSFLPEVHLQLGAKFLDKKINHLKRWTCKQSKRQGRDEKTRRLPYYRKIMVKKD